MPDQYPLQCTALRFAGCARQDLSILAALSMACRFGHYEEKAVEALLQINPLGERANVIAEVQRVCRGLHSRKNDGLTIHQDASFTYLLSAVLAHIHTKNKPTTVHETTGPAAQTALSTPSPRLLLLPVSDPPHEEPYEQ